MPDQLPTASELYKQALPTASDLYDQAQKQQSGTASGIISNYVKPITDLFSGSPTQQVHGPLADAVFDSGPIGRIMKAAGQGAADAWGENKGVYGQKLYESMDPEDAKNDKAIVKSGNEGWLRPLAAKIIAQEGANVINLSRPLIAGAAGVGAGIQQLGEELPRPAGELVEEAMGALPALHGAFPEGIAPKGPESADLRGPSQGPDFSQGADFSVGKHGVAETNPARMPTPLDAPHVFLEARATGVIGEGEAGYFNVGPVTPENLAARTQAANDSGQLLLTHQPEVNTVPTIEDLARKVNPDAFKAWDTAKAKIDDLRENLQLSRKYALGRGKSEGEVSSFSSDIQTKIQALDEHFRDLIPDVSDARQRASDMLNSDSPEGDTFRDWVQAQALEKALGEHGDDVQDAYGRSTDLIRDAEPSIPADTQKPATEALKGPGKGSKNAQGPNGPQPTSAPTGPREGFTGTGPGGEPTDGGSSASAEPTFRSPEEIGVVKGAESKTVGGSQLLQEEALAKGILSEKLSDLPEFQGLNIDQQASAASRFVLRHFEDARKAITGEQPGPRDIHPQMLLQAMKEVAFKTGDTDLVRDIINSPINKKASLEAQSLRLRQGLYETDPTKIIQETEDARRGRNKNEMKAQMSLIQSSIDRATNQFKEDWGSFLKSIACEE